MLGAGFAKPARGPAQADLLDRIVHSSTCSTRLRDFFRRVFQAGVKATASRVALEDVFTVLDRAVLFEENIRGISHRDADVIRRDLIRELVRLLDCGVKYGARPHVQFAEALVQRRVAAGLDGDPFSVISFNWDLLLDTVLYQLCVERNHDAPTQIDYGCFHYLLDTSAKGEVVNSTQAVAGAYNLKLLKLHGSANWLVCPQCAKLFIRFDRCRLLRRARCTFCREHPALNPLIVTPTLLKDLRTVQLQTVWHNAMTELQESDHLVFIGYSFPLADFEFRYLLAKAVRPNACITVVTRSIPRGKNAGKRTRRDLQREGSALEDRYRRFFGRRTLRFLSVGAEKALTNPWRLLEKCD